MFRITGDSNGTPINDTHGPVLLLSGMYSQIDDWLETSDPSLPNNPVQLAQMGWDVYIGDGRGKKYSRSH